MIDVESIYDKCLAIARYLRMRGRHDVTHHFHAEVFV